MWKDGPPTLDKARAFYATRFLEPYRISLLPAPLDDQILDYAVNSGPHLAIMKLQTVLGVTADGGIGPETLHAVATQDLRRTNNNLMAERLKMLARLVQKDRSQAEFIVGWTLRALSFLA